MSDERIDFAAEGLLEGLDGERRRDRLALLERLAADGMPLAQLRQAVEKGNLVFTAADRVVGGPELYTATEVAERSGVELDFLLAARRAMGLPIPAPDEVSFTEGDLQAAQRSRTAIDAGLAEEDVLELLRVLGRNLANAAAALRALPLKLVLRPGMSEVDLALQYGGAVAQLYPLVDPLVSNMLAAHLRNSTENEVVSAMELAGGELPGSREVSICFADLVGFTRLGEELPPDELGHLAARLEALASEVAAPPVHLVKTLGDGAMLAAPTPEPLLDAALELLGASEAQGEEFPQLRAGAASGTAFPRAGDWFGRPVNLASRITSVARPGSLLVEDGVREAAGERYRFSFAGQRRLRGIREPVSLYRVRPQAAT